ncbi:MAG: delta-60 repeat domain-containing protein, partial [Acidimicrobiia bacterium]
MLAIACSGSDDSGPSLGVDAEFSTDSALDDTVGAIAIQADGKIVVGGAFSTPTASLARFNSDGTLDEAFNAKVDGSVAGYVSTVE